jgi:metal-responsive CopG/Arc/MetJ family transcriptional regulator
MKTMTIECPDELVKELDGYVEEGWAVNSGAAVVEALRRFLESHRPDVIQNQIQADVEWGLKGND